MPRLITVSDDTYELFAKLTMSQDFDEETFCDDFLHATAKKMLMKHQTCVSSAFARSLVKYNSLYKELSNEF